MASSFTLSLEDDNGVDACFQNNRSCLKATCPSPHLDLCIRKQYKM